MTHKQNKHREHPIAIALVVHIAFWLLAMGLPYWLEWVTTYGPSYEMHRAIMPMTAWGLLFTIAGALVFISLFCRNLVIKFAARAAASIIIMVWTVLWYVAALQPEFPGYSAVPTYTFITTISILSFYVPSILRLRGVK